MKGQQQGFTLLEILVAFTLMGVIGGTLLQLFQGGLINISKAEQISHAALLAQSKLTELQAIKDLTMGSIEGHYPDDYRWHVSVEPFQQQDDFVSQPLQTLAVTIDIHWDTDARYQLKSLLLSTAKP